jgi:hypothetical protein
MDEFRNLQPPSRVIFWVKLGSRTGDFGLGSFLLKPHNVQKDMLMKPMTLIGALAFATALQAADSPKDDLLAASKKLAAQPNYSWKTTVVVPEGAQFRPGPTEGKTEKEGYTWVKWTFGENTSQGVRKGDKGAVTNREGEWESLADVEKEEGFGRFRAMMVRNLKTPATQVAELAEGTKELKKDGQVYSGELTEATAKSLMTFGRRAGGDGPSVSNAKGSVKFWLNADGTVTKYEFKVQGSVNFNGNDQDVDRTTTVELKDVGATKLTIPEEAKKKMS